MVRLKLFEISEEEEVQETFQFHNGSIKTAKKIKRNSTGIQVSIPQWFD